MFLDRVSIKVLTETNKVQTETDFRPELRTIRTPTLILHGDIDKSCILELTGRPTHQLIPGSRLLIYENAAPRRRPIWYAGSVFEYPSSSAIRGKHDSCGNSRISQSRSISPR